MINLSGEEVCAVEDAITRVITSYNTSAMHRRAMQSVLNKLYASMSPSVAPPKE